jgi:2-polyprenyl-3-methyl-5-hydroxy-6-metoxy-1,4-benzoquinol methylase
MCLKIFVINTMLLSESICFPFVPSIGKYKTSRLAPYHPSIHNLGNVDEYDIDAEKRGWVRRRLPLGLWHAQGAAFVTKIIDIIAYNGRPMRREIAKIMIDSVIASHVEEFVNEPITICDVGCGVALSTRELETYSKTFSEAKFDIIGIDTSDEMLMYAADNVSPSVNLIKMNAIDIAGEELDYEYEEEDKNNVRIITQDEKYVATTPFDIISCTMVMHEMPPIAHKRLIRASAKATRAKNGEIWLVDIDPMYKPSMTMLSGEPFVPVYLNTIESTIKNEAKRLNIDVETMTIVNGHVKAWKLTHKKQL